ncbi:MULTISPECIES: cysteine desulfurase family protein [Bacillus cereus group]|uniref:cysteine desulfurase n=2 Tax=Bacillus cereus group TaxID=86661 RepID=A0A9X6K972_BACTU|nr:MULTISPECIES: cysteine desulfurase family protein [Bacillus cereus group]AGE80285.1 Fe-S cluster formation protein [Bacillus thuringiensis serovar kurstaki str. HD73]AHZ53253.1 class V aminotransferase [Bacillus thuringiensis serovar kurstaki str. YBT-1520]AIE35679.1 class V aminotransferase [Bacillus thuringiensis serovar kurstaki str. HD-1]AIM29939.1 Fe-S cluster formation protein [Bacillus thuringiensis serovar kurstaki str. YBT-1520]AJK42468.1 beta-eliminating lyase family protein [Baci
MERIYLDHAATSPTHPEVVEKMIPYMTEIFGNPSSIHFYGRQTRHTVDEARRVCARSIHANPNEIIFTSGGTEADNLALIGVARANRHKGNHIITTQIEHHAILHTCELLEREGFEVTYLPVDETGRIQVSDIQKALTEETILVSVMFGNNEVGTMQPIVEIGKLLKEHQAYFHTDAVQAYGLVEINVKEFGIDLLSISAHKINGPKGVGFLYAGTNVKFEPLLIGGEQERKRRAGTENVPSIAGLQHAILIAEKTREQKNAQYEEFKDIMVSVFKNEGITFEVNGNLEHRLPHVLNVSFTGMNIEPFLVNLDLAGIAVSSGSACTAGSIDPSHVLVAMFGKDSDQIRSSVRFSFGLGNTKEQIEKAAYETVKIVKRLTQN